ncbi:Bromodomain and PHD finger-containing 3 [Gossypium australe]|uniref:Bromodomain and PHD finger-containing 3 n=1 Tax=Gossypium australe TaxID=47621 RepID=A0A5B6V5U8_9ROSI|nr:Bromodomain and PHD finger-containing 3 [Gossypium australe]
MLSGEYRRSPRIIELDARKAQERSQNKGKAICEVTDEEELDKGQNILKQKRGRKKVKVRTVQDVVVNSVEYKVQKTDIENGEDGLVNAAAIVPSGAAIPEKSKLELLLGILQRKDTQKIFAEPVDPDEVEYYYDVIKEPMDFGTIAKKLNEGSYQTLEEFERDIFLVPNNAMLFNASNTIYYRQARALKELATRLFHALKTDPESFETEASIQRLGLSGRTKAGARTLNKTNPSIVARGCRAQKRAHDVEVDRRRTYRPRNSSQGGNRSLVSAVYNAPKHLMLNKQADLGYIDSLKRFTKDMGPIVQKVANKKIDSYISEAMRVWNMTTNHQLGPQNMQIPNAAFASNIKVAPSFKVPSSTPGYQNNSGDKMNIHTGFSNGGQASVIMNNALTGGISQTGRRVESLGDFQGNMTPDASRDFAPSLHLRGNSAGYQTFAGATMDGPSSFWNGGKVSTVNNAAMNDVLNKGKGKLGNEMDFQEKMFQPMRMGLDSGVAYKDYAVNQSIGVHLDSSLPSYDSGKGELDLIALWNTKGKQKELDGPAMMVNPINVDNTVRKAGHGSSWWMQEPMVKSKIDASSSSWRSPSQVMTGFDGTQTMDYMSGMGSPSQVMTGFNGTQTMDYMSGMGSPSQVMTGLNGTPTMDYMSGMGSHYAGKGMYEKEVIADGQGSSYRSNVEQVGVVSDLFKPAEMGVQPVSEYCFQDETISAELASLLQQKGGLDSLCNVPPDENWFGSLGDKNLMRASEKPLEYERFQPESNAAAAAAATERFQPESNAAAAAATERRQKQTVEGAQQAQWRWL